MKITYKDAGVNVEAGYEAVNLMKEHVKKTFNKDVLTDLGSFGGMYALGDDVLVAGTDGVGTKLKVAFALNKHDTVGIDCVAMCVNDVVCHGAKPLFFLDYFATGTLLPKQAEEIVKGVSDGCIQAGCALIGGETAEMPGFYSKGEYDMAGFCVGIVKKNKIINGKGINRGNVLIGLESSGVHSNGFSLVRRLYPMEGHILSQSVELLGGSLGDALIKPTKIYVKTILDIIDKFNIKGIAHITGGGFIENIPRILPNGLGAEIDTSSYPMQPIFELIMQDSGMSKEDAYNTLNMGIGMVIAIDKYDADKLVTYINDKTEDIAHVIGEVAEGQGVVLK